MAKPTEERWPPHSIVGGERLASLIGVSGISIREQFGALESMAADFGRESFFLAAAKMKLAQKAQDGLGVAGGRQKNERP